MGGLVVRMKLKEFEAQSLLHDPALTFPRTVLLRKGTFFTLSFLERELTFPVVVKAQTLAKQRAKNGLIRVCANLHEVESSVAEFFARMEGEPLNEILISTHVAHSEEHYAALTFDSTHGGPMLILCKEGGIDIERRALSDKIVTVAIDPRVGLNLPEAEKAALNAQFSSPLLVARFLCAAYCRFVQYDMRLLEFNPFIISEEQVIALDCNIALDDAAFGRQRFQFPLRKGFRPLTDRERAAQEIDKDDYRGVAGKSYLDLDGDIAVLASGGGASLTAMDALISYGGRPANYAEYSGNPPAEKVMKLTQITLSKPGLSGCWVVGGTANFTDIYETLRGFIAGLSNVQPRPRYPIVIRRAGPRDKEAFALVRRFAAEHGFDITLLDEKTPITESARVMVERAARYRGEEQ